MRQPSWCVMLSTMGSRSGRPTSIIAMGLHAGVNRRCSLGRPAWASHRARTREPEGALIVAARGHMPFGSVQDLWRRAGVPVAALERLAEADAFGSLGLGRRQALWEVRALGSGVDRYGRKS